MIVSPGWRLCADDRKSRHPVTHQMIFWPELKPPNPQPGPATMCSVFSPTQNVDWVREHFGVSLPNPYPAVTYPGYLAPVVVRGHESGRTACGLARFGLVPSWAKDATIGRRTYNARSETVAQKPSYRAAWRHRHFAIALADDFFEPCYESGRAVRWRIARTDATPLGIASIWDRWTDPATGEVVASFSMLTVNADQHPVMNRFHKPGDEKRTPVVLAPDQFGLWLDASPDSAMAILQSGRMPALAGAPA